MAHLMRQPCKFCGHLEGYIEPKSGQDCVYCSKCCRHQYNAPKTETGRETRSVSTVHEGIKPKHRIRIIERAHGRCEYCNANDRPLHIGHALSVKDGFEAGLSDAQINHEDNLMALCEECNLGQGSSSTPTWLLASILKRRTA